MIFYLKNIVWRAFTRQVGFRTDYFSGRYDFALSFAGADRGVARRLHEILQEREVPTFYDEEEQHRILANNVEEYLAPIYRSEARYVIRLLSQDYPTRIWTKIDLTTKGREAHPVMRPDFKSVSKAVSDYRPFPGFGG